MRNTLILFFLCLTLSQSFGQEKEYSEKVNSIDNIIETLYTVISGEKGEARDWKLFKYLLHKDAKLIPSGNNRQGVTGVRFMSPDEYIATSGKWLLENGFFEKEIGRKTEQFGNIAHIFSTYESFRSESETKPFMRGINSIQLLYDGNRWWILNIFWQGETPKQPIPKKYID